MSADVSLIGEEDHPLSVGRNVREPIVVAVGSDLLLFRAVGLHAPDLHHAGALGIEINIFSIGRIFGAVVEALGGGETRFFASGGGNGVDVKIAVAFPDKGESSAVRRPAMPIRGRTLGDAPGSTAGERNDVHDGAMLFLRLIADGQLLAVRRNSVVVVAADGKAAVDPIRLGACSEGQAINAAVAIEE